MKGLMVICPEKTKQFNNKWNFKASNLYRILRPFTCGVSPAPVAQWVECPLQGTTGHGFDPVPQHTKSLKMV